MIVHDAMASCYLSSRTADAAWDSRPHGGDRPRRFSIRLIVGDDRTKLETKMCARGDTETIYMLRENVLRLRATTFLLSRP